MASRGKKSKIQKKEDKVLYAGGIELREGSIKFDDPDMTWDKFYDYVVELDKQEERLQKRKKTNYPINPTAIGIQG